MAWPKVVPFIGGTTLASATFVFDYQGEDPATQEPIGYVAAWIDVDYLVGHANVGFLIDINDTQVSDPQLIGNHTINQIKAAPMSRRGRRSTRIPRCLPSRPAPMSADSSASGPSKRGRRRPRSS